jgi:superfamily II DNA/RNA helicase
MPKALLHRFGKPFKLRCCAAFGGLQKYAQVKALQAGQEVAVATPGRLIDLVTSKACDFERVTIVVVDEVDRCFDLGFEAQVGSLYTGKLPKVCLPKWEGFACFT